MNIHVREATEADYPAVGAVLTAAQGGRTVSAADLKASAEKTRTHPKGLHLAQWVAETRGEIVGFAGVVQWAGSHHPDRYNTTLAVPPQFGRQGIGTALAETVQAHLQGRGVQEVLAAAKENEPYAVAFLERRGFTELEREFANILHMADLVPLAVSLPAGYRLTSLQDFRAEVGEERALEAFRATFNEARADEPRQIPAQPYSMDDIRAYLKHPTFLPEGIWLAVTPSGMTQSGEVAALTELWQDLGDPQRLSTGLTGTARAHRRRGLALALKVAALERAQRRGIRQVITHNASVNVPMLAINEKLGFKPEPADIQMRWGAICSKSLAKVTQEASKSQKV